jgi:hypothetical protein
MGNSITCLYFLVNSLSLGWFKELGVDWLLAGA